MASLSHDGGSKWRILIGSEAGRKTIRYNGPQRDAERFKDNVERLAATRGDVPAKLLAWLGELPDKLHARIAKAGLCDPRIKADAVAGPTLKEFLDRLFAAMTAKPATKTFYDHTRRNLDNYFGKGKPLAEISTVEADEWRAWLVQDQKLSPATVSRRVIAARGFWKQAIRWKYATENPFTGMKAGKQHNDKRLFFVPHDVIDKAIAEAVDTEWQVIIALARYGGLRTPSETFALRWADVDFDNGRMVIHSSKTEHHEGGETRNVPLFSELRPYLETLFTEAAGEGGVYVIHRNRLAAGNLRTQFNRILGRAGIEPWPRLFHNLRGSRETELMQSTT